MRFTATKDLTEYLQKTGRDAEEVVQEMRDKARFFGFAILSMALWSTCLLPKKDKG